MNLIAAEFSFLKLHCLKNERDVWKALHLMMNLKKHNSNSGAFFSDVTLFSALLSNHPPKCQILNLLGLLTILVSKRKYFGQHIITVLSLKVTFCSCLLSNQNSFKTSPFQHSNQRKFE